MSMASEDVALDPQVVRPAYSQAIDDGDVTILLCNTPILQRAIDTIKRHRQLDGSISNKPGHWESLIPHFNVRVVDPVRRVLECINFDIVWLYIGLDDVMGLEHHRFARMIRGHLMKPWVTVSSPLSRILLSRLVRSLTI
jgi:hypothetical protein